MNKRELWCKVFGHQPFPESMLPAKRGHFYSWECKMCGTYVIRFITWHGSIGVSILNPKGIVKVDIPI